MLMINNSNQIKSISGGVLCTVDNVPCSGCAPSPGSYWVEGLNCNGPSACETETKTPSIYAFLAITTSGALGGLLSGARFGPWGMLAFAISGAAMAAVGRAFFDAAAIKDSLF